MKSLGLLLLWLGIVIPPVSSVDFAINPWTFQDVSAGLGYPNFNATAGDTITFVFTNEVHNVFIHPSGNCENQTGRITVGNVSPVVYTVTEFDGTLEGNPLFFACDVDDHCEVYGMHFTVTVFTAETLPPVVPTDAPVAAPVAAPTAPTDPPVEPTEAPVAPTEAPVAPTDAPVAPTDPPVEPTDAPAAPIASPVSPTDAPEAPTEAPVAPTDAPVAPVASPVESPTKPPVKPTGPPTPEPTKGAPIAEPTPAPNGVAPVPTLNPTGDVTTKSLPDLRMKLFGISDFPVSAQSVWQDETTQFSTSYVFNELQGEVSSFETTYTVTDHLTSSTQRSRQRLLSQSRDLQQDEDFVTVIYTQVMSYKVIGGSSVTADQLATQPFASDAQRQSFVSLLDLSSDSTLSQVTSISDVQVPASTPTSSPVSVPTAPPSGDGQTSSGLSTGVIIGIACGGGAFLLLILGVVYFMYCRSGPSLESKKNEPPMSVLVKDDEVSTLAGPQTVQGGTNGDQSVATVDYDYSKAYGGGDTSVSSAGGTFGSNTQNQSAFDLVNAAATGATLGPFDDDGSFEAHYRDPSSNVKEEILHIFAPPGKLGVVIDTPDDGAPVVHAVKESSVVADKVQVGDKLVAVDDEDVRTMTAVKVSKLISRKSANPSRKLTVLRTTLIE